jgi:hypothetical protein
MTIETRMFAVGSLNEAHSIAMTLREVGHRAEADVKEASPIVSIEAQRDEWNTVEDIVRWRDPWAEPVDLG